MPKKEEIDERILRIEIPPLQLSKEGAFWSPASIAALSNGWLIYDNTTPYWQGTIDLSGYARDYKTFYPDGAFIQEGPYMLEPGCDGTLILTVVSSVPLDPAVLSNQMLSPSGPGFLDTGAITAVIPQLSNQQNWDTVMFSEADMRAINSLVTPNTDGILLSLYKNQSGSLAPTASDTLYVTKMIFSMNYFGNSTALIFPASRIVIPGTMGEEPTVEYMMRLKRSTELANQV